MDLADAPGADLEKDVWKQLTGKLEEAYAHSYPHEMAMQVIAGWTGYAGPAFESEYENAVNRIGRTAARSGFREITRHEIEQQCMAACNHWRSFRERELTDNGGTRRYTVDAAAPLAADPLRAANLLPEPEIAVALKGGDLDVFE